MSDLFDEFIAESRQQIEAAERALLILARAPNSEAVQACFRALHTLKGNSGFFPLPRIQQLAHVSEQVLDALRDDRIPCDSARIDALLASLSLLAQLIDSVGDGAPEPVGDDSAQLAEEYRRVNPMGRVPTLILPDGTVVTESLAILLTLEGRHPEAALLPAPDDPADRAQLGARGFIVASRRHEEELRIRQVHAQMVAGEAAAVPVHSPALVLSAAGGPGRRGRYAEMCTVVHRRAHLFPGFGLWALGFRGLRL